MFRLLAGLLTVACWAQSTRAIHVTVTAEDKPVAAATVSVNGLTTQTDPAGIATAAATGPAEITVTKDGFLPATASLGESESEARVELEALEEQITVYATRTGVRIDDSPLKVEVLDREEIEEKMMMTPGDIVMMLNEMGGLRVQSTSPGLGAASLRIQGMRGRYTLFLSDGLPLFGQQGGGLGLLQVPPTDLGQVEVIKGVSSALFGAGAMAGVVNLIARRPGKEPIHEFLLNRSTLGATNGSLFLASGLTEHWSGSFLGSGDFQQRRDLNHDGWADVAGYSRGVVRPRFYWNGGEGRSALITGGYTYETRHGGMLSWPEGLETRRYDLGWNLQMLLGGKYLLTARAAASSQQHEHTFGPVTERDKHEMLLGEVSVRGTFHRNTWVAGAAENREAYRPADVPRFAYTYSTPGIFLQDDFNVASWLSVSASGRADFQSRYGVFFSPRFSALTRWKGWIARLSAGTGFFAPTPLTEETETAGLSRLAIPKPLLAERGRSASFDLTRSYGPFTYTATLFASDLRHAIYVQRDPVYQIVNLPGPARNTGGELLATFRKTAGKSSFPVTASYTYVRSREMQADTPLTPRQSAGISGMWEREEGRIGLEAYYTGTQRLEDNPYRSTSKPYLLFGFFAERKLGPARLFLNAENLGNVRQTRWDPLLRPAQSADGRWTVDAWSPLDGRVINGGVRFRF